MYLKDVYIQNVHFRCDYESIHLIKVDMYGRIVFL